MPVDTTAPGFQTGARSPLAQRLDAVELAALQKLLEEVSYSAGETIFHENEPGEAAYFIRTGTVRISTHDENAHEVSLAQFGPNDIFGELSVLDGEPRSASATAIKDTTLGRLSKENLRQFLLEHPQVALYMIAELGRRLRETNKLI